MARLFDPLGFLSRDLACAVWLDALSRPRLGFDRLHTPRQVRQAQTVARVYERLLILQLAQGRASVRKLLARGRIELKDGRYRLAPGERLENN